MMDIGMKAPKIDQVEMTDEDIEFAERIAKRLRYQQTAYTSTSALWGLFCLPENPLTSHNGEPIHGGCIIKTKQFGFLFVSDLEDMLMHDLHAETVGQ